MGRFPLLLGVAGVMGAAACEAPQPTDACSRYTECVRALDEQRAQETNLDRFDPGGACWGHHEQARVCTAACEAGRALVFERWEDPPEECAP
jgi:hypothetical protein